VQSQQARNNPRSLFHSIAPFLCGFTKKGRKKEEEFVCVFVEKTMATSDRVDELEATVKKLESCVGESHFFFVFFRFHMLMALFVLNTKDPSLILSLTTTTLCLYSLFIYSQCPPTAMQPQT
jgi:hypothetical protein